jgi:hypothetical protein
MFLDCKRGTAMAAGTTMTGTVIGYNGAVSMGQTVFLMEGYSLMLACPIYGTRKQQFQRKSLKSYGLKSTTKHLPTCAGTPGRLFRTFIFDMKIAVSNCCIILVA